MSSQSRGGKRPSKKKGAKKSSLPAFGFTDDLLKGRSAGSAEAASASEPVESSAAEAPEATAPAATPPKIILPAFGFAKDLLAKVRGDRGVADRGEADRGEKADDDGAPRAPEAQTEPEAQPAAEPAQDPEGGGEDRIFAFTDSLDGRRAEEEAVAPVRLETWITFSLVDEIFALPVDPVHEIVRFTSITRVPHAPFPIRGVTNLRGRVVPVIDLRLRLELPASEITRGSRIVVVGSRGRRLGLLVDAVHQVVHLDVDRVQQPPDDVMTVQSDYIFGVYHLGEQLILLLDVDRVLIIREPSDPGRPGEARPGPAGPTATQPTTPGVA